MKKIQIVFLFIFCLFSFSIANAETLIIKSVDKRIEDIEKSREKLQKDNEDNYKQLQDQLKSLSASINTNQSIEDQAKAEYEYQLKVYELKSEIACINKEGLYSSFNKNTKECECVEGSTFVNGKCESRLNNLLLCVKSFGPLAYYNYEKTGCVCEEGSEFNWDSNGLCTKKDEPTIENKYIPVSERPKTPKEKIKIPTPIIPIIQVEDPSQAKIAPNTSYDISSSIVPIQQKVTFWQKLKNNILKIKFW